MTEHHNTTLDAVKATINWAAALLGIGSFAGLVNLFVGVLSGLWISAQLYRFFFYTLPADREARAERLKGKV